MSGDSLPEVNLLYKLENEIKNANSKKIINRITSPFRRKRISNDQDDIQSKEQKYREIKESYENFEIERNSVKDKYTRLYGNTMGNPYIDSLESEVELINLLERYMSIKLAVFQNEMSINQRIVYESYKHYIDSLENKIEIIKEEEALLDVQINLKITEHENILPKISSLRDLVEINKEKMNKVLREVDNKIISDTELFVSTVISSAHPLLKDKSFDWVIMDEASQVPSYMSLIPLLKTERFILVGDDKQLQPIEESNLSDHLNLSIFNRLLMNFPNVSTFLVPIPDE